LSQVISHYLRRHHHQASCNASFLQYKVRGEINDVVTKYMHIICTWILSSCLSFSFSALWFGALRLLFFLLFRLYELRGCSWIRCTGRRSGPFGGLCCRCGVVAVTQIRMYSREQKYYSLVIEKQRGASQHSTLLLVCQNNHTRIFS